MVKYFTNLAKNKLKNELFCHPIDYGFKPFQDVVDLSWAFFSIAVLPVYYFMLACLVLVEAFFSLGQVGYYRLRSNYEEDNQYLVESKASAVIGFQISCICVGIAPLLFIIFLLRLAITFVLPITNNREVSQDPSLAKGSSDRTTALSRYADLVENAKVEISIINNALSSYNMEARAFGNNHKNTHHENGHERQSILAFSYFQATNEQIAILREQELSDDLLNVYQELVQSYPLYTFDGPIRLDEIELACISMEAHHSKVLESAEAMLSNLHSLLNMAKQMDATASSTMKV